MVSFFIFCLSLPSAALKGFYMSSSPLPPTKKNICVPFYFFVGHINGAISLKRLQSQIIHCRPPFEGPNASNWVFITHKLHLPLFFLFLLLFPFFYFFFKISPLWHLFFFLPATLSSDIEPLPVGVLSCLTPVHIFAVPSPPPTPAAIPPSSATTPQTMSFWLNTLSELLFCLLLF